MRPRRFFAAEAAPGKWLALSPSEAHHLREVLRLKEGAEIEIVNGRGEVYPARVIRIQKDEVRVHLLGPGRRESPPAYRLEILLPLLKGGRTEFLVEKAVELGVTTIRVFYGRYGARKPGERIGSRLRERAVQALKQCGRLWLPEIYPPVPLSEALEEARAPDRFFAYERGGEPLSRAFTPFSRDLALVVGPEGGFAPEEEKLLKEKGFRPLTLGPYILRAETACLFLMSVWRYHTLLDAAASPSGLE